MYRDLTPLEEVNLCYDLCLFLFLYRRVVWRRVVDMNDRALRQITASLGGISNGFPREAGFDITVASEVMACLCLANDFCCGCGLF